MNKECVICNNSFYIFPYRIKQNPKYCSSKCYGISKKGHIPWNKGKEWSEEVKKKLSESHKGLKPWNWKPKPLLACEYCNIAFYPKRPSDKNLFCSKKCADSSRVGIASWNKGMKFPEKSGEKHPNWKGNSVSYSGLHKWVVVQLGKPKRCDICKTTKEKRYEWANKSQKYKRDVSDWLRLCGKCHKKYDSSFRVKGSLLYQHS